MAAGADGKADGRTIDRLNKLLPVATGVAGLVVYVYVFGGLVAWARLTASRLYTDSAINALGSKSLLATGLKVVAFEIVVLALVSWLTWRLGGRFGVGGESSSQEKKEGALRVGSLIVQGVLVAFVAACLLSLLSLPPLVAFVPAVVWVSGGLKFEDSDFFEIADNRRLRWGLGLPVVVCAILFSAAAPGISALILLALVINEEWFEKLLSEKSTDRIAPILTVLAAFSLIVLAFITTPPVTFDRVTIIEKQGGTIEGGYVARSGDGIFVATCKQFRDNPYRSKKPRLQVIPNDSVKELTLGGDRYAIDNGKRPSLFDLGLHLFSQGKIDEHFGGWRPSARGKLEVCIDTKTLR